MLNDIRPELIIFFLLLAAVWVVSILLVAWDAWRRQLPARWILLSLIPFAGALAYLAGRLHGHTTPQRVTALKPPEMDVARQRPAEKRMATVLAADLLRQDQAQPASTLLDSYALVAEEGPHQGQRFTLTALPLYIGRDLDCAVRLDDDHGVSRHHAELYRQNGRLRIKDLNSTHGTFVNGRQVQDAELVPGDTLKLGHSLLIVNERAQENP
jgi:hypothetical protein